jgi:hypothetical protein
MGRLVPPHPFGALVSLNEALDEEQRIEREKDRAYWDPLKKDGAIAASPS